MKTSLIDLSRMMAVVLVGVVFVSPAQGQYMGSLLDDFEDGTIDTAKWNPLTPTGSITEADGVIKLANRPALMTVGEFDPSMPLSMSFDMYFTDTQSTGETFFHTDNTTRPQDGYSVEGLGLFWDNYQNRFRFIVAHTGGHVNIIGGVGNISVTWPEEIWLSAEVLDDGTDVSVEVYEKETPENVLLSETFSWATDIQPVLDSVGLTLDQHYVNFSCRNKPSPVETHYDNMNIQSIPEPASLVLLLMGLVIGGICSRVRW